MLSLFENLKEQGTSPWFCLQRGCRLQCPPSLASHTGFSFRVVFWFSGVLLGYLERLPFWRITRVLFPLLGNSIHPFRETAIWSLGLLSPVEGLRMIKFVAIINTAHQFLSNWNLWCNMWFCLLMYLRSSPLVFY